jgi:hypothetical protein
MMAEPMKGNRNSREPGRRRQAGKGSRKKPPGYPSANSAVQGANSDFGIMRLEPENGRSFVDFQARRDLKPPALMPGRFMLTITILGLIFITIITWFVSRMPEK